MPLTKGDILTAKRVFAEQRTPGFFHRQRADVHAFHLELMRFESGIEQGHGNGIRFFTG
ncbi:hypothetical protein D3C86_2240130 [compost metagenome]